MRSGATAATAAAGSISMSNARIVHAEQAATDRLAALGLTPQLLRDALLAGELARSSCTENDPPALGGILGWARTTRGLREQTAPIGWRRNEAGQLSTVVDPSGTIAIAVATGDERTGLDGPDPRTKYPKGPATAAAVEQNRVQLRLAFEPEPEAAPTENEEPRAVTWLLLLSRTDAELRAELSLPGLIGADDRVESWAERILLEPIDLRPTPDLEQLGEPTAIDVPVRRRA